MNPDNFNEEESVFFEPGYIIFHRQPRKRSLKFLSTGYAIEFRMIGGHKQVERFIDPSQVILALDKRNTIVILTASQFIEISWENLVALTRKHPHTAELHKAIKLKQFEIIRNHRESLATKTIAERYFDLLESQPWVKEHADEEDIASYLRISLAQYHKLCALE
ncbi:MAG TPA: hypothetical protein VKB19_17315 [Pedobacter sp.]|nr:hypothetical protein [Pedobacter sp.]